MNIEEIEKKLKKGISASNIGIKHQMLCEVLAQFKTASAPTEEGATTVRQALNKVISKWDSYMNDTRPETRNEFLREWAAQVAFIRGE